MSADSVASGQNIEVGAALIDFVVGVNEDFLLAPAERPHAVRCRLQAAIASRDFLLDCFRLVFSRLSSRTGNWVLFLDPAFRYKLQLFSWPPGMENEPHLHNNWNVSAVVAGSLMVFRSAISEADCRMAAPLRADMGGVGVLVPPQFHFLRNDGQDTALTFHVFSMGAPNEDVHSEERSAVTDVRFDDSEIVAIARAAVRSGGFHAKDILRVAFSFAGHAGKLEVVKLMASLNPDEAIQMGRALAEIVGGLDGGRLLAVIEKLEIAARQDV